MRQTRKLGAKHCISMADVVIKMRGEKRDDTW